MTPWTPAYAKPDFGGFNWWPVFLEEMSERARKAGRTGEPIPMTELEAKLLGHAVTTSSHRVPEGWWSQLSPKPLFLGQPVVIVDPFGATW